MNTRLRNLLFGLALGIGSSSVALAATVIPDVNLGTLSPTPVDSGAVNVPLSRGTDFEGKATFSLDSMGNAGVSGAPLNLTLGMTQIFGIENFLLGGLFTSGGGSVDSSTSGTGLTFNELAAGSYYFLIRGTVTGTNGAYFAVAGSASPVPLPTSVLLLGAGLVGLVAIARRRKVTADAMPAAA